MRNEIKNYYALFVIIANLYGFIIVQYTELVRPLKNELLNIPIFPSFIICCSSI